MVSGSDTHGTPMEVAALKQGITAKTLTERNHKKVAELFKLWDTSFDNYTSTESPVHKEFVQKSSLANSTERLHLRARHPDALLRA